MGPIAGVVAFLSFLSSQAMHQACFSVENELQYKHDLSPELYRGRAIEILSEGTFLNVIERNKLKEALQKTIANGDCTDESLEHIALIGNCGWTWDPLTPLSTPARNHLVKCLTPEYLKDSLKRETGKIFDLGGFFGVKKASQVLEELIDEQFVEDYRSQESVEDRRLALYLMPVHAYKLPKPFAKLLEREVKKQGEDARQAFRYLSDVKKFIGDKVVGPCKGYVPAVTKVTSAMDLSENLLGRDGEGKLYENLDKEAQMIVARGNFCDQVELALHESDLARKVLEELKSGK